MRSDPIPVSWSAHNGLSFVANARLFNSSAHTPLPDVVADVSVAMRHRATAGYAFALERNEQIAAAQATDTGCGAWSLLGGFAFCVLVRFNTRMTRHLSL